MGEGECDTIAEEPTRKSRHRKKHFYNTIAQQMEFYFSDSNLTKDRFLSQLLGQDPNVDIEIFLKFNKIRKLNCTVEDIQKAIRNSELIGITEDKSKIFRKQPVKVKENLDYCTIYVENIKADATHESLSKIFSDFGNVVYVSIPKYKHNKSNKGFAFIEYENEQQANEAITFFEGIGCKIPLGKNPEDLQSIKTFEGETSMITQENVKKRKQSSDEEEGDKKRMKEDVEKDTEKNEDQVKLDKEKHEIKNEEVDHTNEDAKKEKEDTVAKAEETEEGKKKKKNKKEKRKNFIKELGMQVLTKKEWKKLRNSYLDMQKKKMREFKQYLYKQKFSAHSYRKENEELGDEAYQEHNMEHIESTVEETAATKLTFTSGVIVKLKLPEPCMDVKKLKAEIKSLTPEVKFVDVPLPAGSEEVFVRFSTSEAAADFCNTEFSGEKSVLEGNDEKTYWAKIENDRTVKFTKEKKKQRGREKLLKKAEKVLAKHMRFDENE